MMDSLQSRGSSHYPIPLAGKIRPTVIDKSKAIGSNYRFASARITRLGEGIYIALPYNFMIWFWNIVNVLDSVLSVINDI